MKSTSKKHENLHEMPADLQKVINSDSVLKQKWDGLTALAKNEWICWVTFFKKQDTRQNHIERLEKEILEGKKRPCCWAGCPHRNPNAMKWQR